MRGSLAVQMYRWFVVGVCGRVGLGGMVRLAWAGGRSMYSSGSIYIFERIIICIGCCIIHGREGGVLNNVLISEINRN